VIAVDTNILARYYVDDPGDVEAASQRPRAERVMRDSTHVFVPVTVVLELTWVLQSFYTFSAADCAHAIEHLVGLPNVTVESWPKVLEATRLLRAGLDFADALHLASSNRCETFLTFDDQRFAKRAQKLGCVPLVRTPD
jgi:predicted nucleic-acid-binding protein